MDPEHVQVFQMHLQRCVERKHQLEIVVAVRRRSGFIVLAEQQGFDGRGGRRHDRQTAVGMPHCREAAARPR